MIETKVMTSAEVRRRLVDELRLDLVGPPAHDLSHPLAREKLFERDAPSRWYLTGFIEPASSERKGDDDAGDEIGGVETGAAADDNGSSDTQAARKALMPSSLGLSVLVPATVGQVQVHVAWGHYDRQTILQEELDSLLAARRSADGGDGGDDGGEAPRNPIVVTSGDSATESPRKDHGPRAIWVRVPHAPPPIVLNMGSLPSDLAVEGSYGLVLYLVSRPLPSGDRILSVYLVNERDEQILGRETAKVFQAELTLRIAADQPGFVARPDLRTSPDPDDRTADLQYRDVMEHVVGHGVAAETKLDEDGECRCVRSAWIPESTVLRVAPKPIDGGSVELDPNRLGELTTAAAVHAALDGLPTAYAAWIEEQRKSSTSGLDGPEGTRTEWALQLMQRAEQARGRIQRGINKVADDGEVRAAFALMNRALSLAGRQRRAASEGKPIGEVRANTWRPFQLAFILLALEGTVDGRSPDRKIADLLFFPTGGGKTEAYLGLAAIAMALRRLRNPNKPEAYRGTSVLMRYTLRLLTLDQLGRAAGLVCALELERLRDPKRLGSEPFEIGLWVGSKASPNRMGSAKKNHESTARYKVRRYKADTKAPLPVPLESCPWCGSAFGSESFKLVPDDDKPTDLILRCANLDCEPAFRERLPIVTVDEPLYERLPAFLIATVDKFALLPWFGDTGRVLGTGHPGDGVPTEATLRRMKPVPPPDLIIQDELHLISGPLGTMVGLYESAIDALSATPSEDSASAIRPKIIASTATVRRAEAQIRALFARKQTALFPPPGRRDRKDSFFAVEAGDPDIGRLYVGVAAQGRSGKVVLLRTYQVLLSAAKRMWNECRGLGRDNPVDPYMTLLGYFGALRELGGSRRIVEDEVRSNVQNRARRRRLNDLEHRFANRTINFEPVELTSRETTAKVAEAKARLALPWTDSVKKGGKDAERRVDVALATNMISVGLDITRLGLMVALGQPKSSAEYIQATSRVGRDDKKPGLVVTLLNVHKPRDRSHYERFEYYHQTFYRAVEATSVTPFSQRALDRALPAVLIALVRHGAAALTTPAAAAAIEGERKKDDGRLERWLVTTMTDRANAHRDPQTDEEVEEREHLVADVTSRVRVILDGWQKAASDSGGNLKYGRYEDAKNVPGAVTVTLLKDMLANEREQFRAPMSMREVEPEIPIWIRGKNGQLITDGD